MKPALSNLVDALYTAWKGVGDALTNWTKLFAASGPLEGFMTAILEDVEMSRLALNLSVRVGSVRSGSMD